MGVSSAGSHSDETRREQQDKREGEGDEALFLSSADWMGRNMVGRIEVAWPVRDPRLRQRIIDECLVPYLLDERDAWTLDADGHYHPVAGGAESAQQALIRRYAGHS